MRLTLVPAGNFIMGENSESHPVTLTKSFYVGIKQVTQKQFEFVMESKPSIFKRGSNPVETVSWNEAVEFCRRLSAEPKEKRKGRLYRLLTEAEWEYACRAGTTTMFSFGDNAKQLVRYAWCYENSREPHPVGSKKPNPWGLYDMHGNVWEWCWDRYGNYPEGLAIDPKGPANGWFRVIRGGGWKGEAVNCRSASRDRYSPTGRDYDIGFRVAMSSLEVP